MNEKEFNFCRVDAWHGAGFTGKGMKVAIQEVSGVTSMNWPRYEGKVLDVTGTRFSEKLDTHQQNVIDTMRLIIPDAEVHLMGDNWLESLRYCTANKIDVFNYSGTGGYNSAEFNELEAQALAAGVTFVCAAGNDGAQADSLTGFSRKKTWVSVGAVQWLSWQGVEGPYRRDYSSWDLYGDNLDVMGFADGLRIPSSSGVTGVTGTSFASPWVVGLITLWKQKFIADNGRKPTHAETFKFVLANAHDMEATGYDQKTGYGVLRLPEIPQFDVIELWSGTTEVRVNGKPRSLYVAPTLIAGRNMVGLRDVADLTGWSTFWDGTQNKITMTRQRGL